jgi:hypothetical protein
MIDLLLYTIIFYGTLGLIILCGMCYILSYICSDPRSTSEKWEQERKEYERLSKLAYWEQPYVLSTRNRLENLKEHPGNPNNGCVLI